jgi:hypothetical protein
MSNTPGHVCQPTSRADTLQVLYSLYQLVTMSTTFSIEQFTITRLHECVPFPPDGYKCLTEGPPESTSSHRHKCNHPFQPSFSSHLFSWLAIRTTCSPGLLKTLVTASCSAHGAASSTDSKYDQCRMVP